MSTPQKYLTYLYWTFLGAMALGGIIGVLNDTFDFVTLPLTIGGSIIIVLFWVGTPQYLKWFPWTTKTGKVTRLNIGLKLPLVGMLILLWLPQITTWISPLTLPREKEGETLILIATFDHTDNVMDTDIHGEIYRALTETKAQYQLENIRVLVEPTTIPSLNKDAAEELAQKYNASLIIWGADTGVRLQVNLLNLKQPDSATITLNETERTQLAQPAAFNDFVINDLPDQIAYLAVSTLGQAAYNQAVYNRSAYNQADFDAALLLIQTAVNLLPELASTSVDLKEFDTYFRLGWLYQQDAQPQLSLAIDNYNKAIQLNPDHPATYTNRGVAYAVQGDLTQAIADFNKAIQLDPHFANAYTNRGAAHADQGDLTLAIADYHIALQLDPNSVEAYINRGADYFTQGNLDLAIADFNKAIQLDPNFAMAYNNRGAAYNAQGDLDLAIADYNKAIQLDPNFADAYDNRGSTYRAQGNLALAITDHNKAIQLNPNFFEAYFNRGLAYNNQGNHALAIADYSKAIQLNPNNPTTYTNRGNVYRDQGDMTLAIADYNMAIQLNSDNPATYSNRGVVYMNQGNLVQAIADHNKAIQLDPNFANAYYNRGLAYENQGNLAEAIVDYQQYLSLAPNTFDRTAVESHIQELQQQLSP